MNFSLRSKRKPSFRSQTPESAMEVVLTTSAKADLGTFSPLMRTRLTKQLYYPTGPSSLSLKRPLKTELSSAPANGTHSSISAALLQVL